MINKILKKNIVISIISIIFLASFPIVISSENILLNEITNKSSTDNGDIEFKVFGFMRFFVLVKKKKNEVCSLF